MKVLSIIEPWASLIKEQIKFVETRSWKTNYRGELYIHASKRKLTKKEGLRVKKQLSLLENIDFKYGHIIAKCKLIDCKYMDQEFLDNMKQNKTEYLCGEYRIGRYAWILSNIEVLDNPIEVKGMLGIWNYTNDEKN